MISNIGHDSASTTTPTVLARLQASLGPETPVAGLPSGLVARSVQKIRAEDANWRQVRDRRRRQRLDEVVIMTTQAPPVDIATHLQSVLGLSPGVCNFVLGAQRRSWRAIEERFRGDAFPAAVSLVQCGAIYLKCTVTEELSLGSPSCWYLTGAAAACAAKRAEAATAARTDLDGRRRAALASLMNLLSSPGTSLQTGSGRPAMSREAIEALAAALESAHGPARLPVLTAAAEDLFAGAKHGSPRAFSLAHFAHSKERDDAAALLADAGIPDELAAVLGILRSPRIGIAGSIDAIASDREIQLSLLDGPVLIRADQPDLALFTSAQNLVIVENLQAAETLAQHPALQPLAIVYSAGQPSAPARRLIASLCGQVDATLLCPDADLGGVRIARAILGELPGPLARSVTVSDAGTWPHQPQPPWPADGVTVTGLIGARDGLAGELARACLERGYRVEQEQSIHEAVRDWLSQEQIRATPR